MKIRKLFPKWKTVNTISRQDLMAQVGHGFVSGYYKIPCIIYVQLKDKVFSDGQWIRCLVKTAVGTETMNCSVIMAQLGINTYDELEKFKF
jgi:hypothetical protein